MPVLLDESIDALRPESGGIYADLTLGGGGHARTILDRSAPAGRLLGLDRDGEAVERARSALKEYEGRIFLKQGNFRDAGSLFAEYEGRVAGAIMDLGAASGQLVGPERGFSLLHDGPLDMRMDRTQFFRAEDLVNRGRPEELLYAIGTLGEEPKARAIVKAILEARAQRPLLRTSDLRGLVERVYGRKGGRIHPATRTFMGVRMKVNEEMESLAAGLDGAFGLLAPGGRLAVISFHSGEDRAVKQAFQARAAAGEAIVLTRKPIRPSAAEMRRNRRSRSAGLRLLEKRASPGPRE